MKRFPFALLTIILFMSIATQGRADQRLFTFTYEATTQPKGAGEYEQWVTWKTNKGNDASFDRIEFRHELEFGLTDNFQLGIYLSDWRYQGGASVQNDRAEWNNVAVEGILNLTNPVTDPLGIGLYGEVKLGDEKFVLEPKLLLQKNIGKFVFAYNFVFEAEWEGQRYSDDKLVIENIFGASYEVCPSLSLGGELVHEIEYDDWADWGDHVVYLGPNLAFRGKGWWATVTPLFQITDVDSEVDFMTRFIFGISF